MSSLVYFLIIKPISLLPYWLLYRVSDFLFLIIYYVLGYRKDTVRKNLENSFPDYPESEKLKIARASYGHFCDLLVESIKAFSISPKTAIKRAKFVNPEVIEKFYKENRSVILVAGHYANWEIMAVSGDLQISHQLVGLYHPLNNKFYDKKVKSSRTQYGTLMVSKDEFGKYFSDVNKEKAALVFVADQSPKMSKQKKIYWTKFMNRDAPIPYGPEKYAREYNIPVVYIEVTKKKRGYYEAFLEVLEENPSETPEYEITEKHVRRLEKTIRQDPRYYLWTHRRWKHKRQKYQ